MNLEWWTSGWMIPVVTFFFITSVSNAGVPQAGSLYGLVSFIFAGVLVSLLMAGFCKLLGQAAIRTWGRFSTGSADTVE